jgi:hypothetical protein
LLARSFPVPWKPPDDQLLIFLKWSSTEWDDYRHNKTVVNSFMWRSISTTFPGAKYFLHVIILNCFKRREKKIREKNSNLGSGNTVADSLFIICDSLRIGT